MLSDKELRAGVLTGIMDATNGMSENKGVLACAVRDFKDNAISLFVATPKGETANGVSYGYGAAQSDDLISGKKAELDKALDANPEAKGVCVPYGATGRAPSPGSR